MSVTGLQTSLYPRTITFPGSITTSEPFLMSLMSIVNITTSPKHQLSLSYSLSLSLFCRAIHVEGDSDNRLSNGQLGKGARTRLPSKGARTRLPSTERESSHPSRSPRSSPQDTSSPQDSRMNFIWTVLVGACLAMSISAQTAETPAPSASEGIDGGIVHRSELQSNINSVLKTEMSLLMAADPALNTRKFIQDRHASLVLLLSFSISTVD